MRMNSKSILAASTIALGSALLFTGCNLKSVRAYGECSGKQAGGGECKAGMEVIWEGDGGGLNS